MSSEHPKIQRTQLFASCILPEFRMQKVKWRFDAWFGRDESLSRDWRLIDGRAASGLYKLDARQCTYIIYIYKHISYIDCLSSCDSIVIPDVTGHLFIIYYLFLNGPHPFLNTLTATCTTGGTLKYVTYRHATYGSFSRSATSLLQSMALTATCTTGGTWVHGNTWEYCMVWR